MFKVQTLNKISPIGLRELPRDIYDISPDMKDPDAIIVRSFNMLDMELPSSLKVIARAGAGVNNIPLEKCSERGIIVFNTPGANANGVKEIVLAGLLLSSRKVVDGITWTKSLIGKGEEIPQLVEKGKAQYDGPEITGKKLGVIGLGAVGVLVANDAIALGMNVIGYDPFITIEHALALSRSVKMAPSLDQLLAEADYISLHVPLTDETKGMINQDKFSLMKKGARLLNFARGGLVNNKDLLAAIDAGIISVYVTDFPNEELLKSDKVIGIPHLGASTPESEDNCAVMAALQLRGYLERGNLKNCVNFPDCEMPFSQSNRLLIINKNVPKMVGQITAIIADKNINITDMLNRNRDNYAYNIIDIEGTFDMDDIKKLLAINGVIMVRYINCN
ncbi:MAG TPA: phosphoglycerate dehydrogenase [bacterium]|nr:phosphoglycerate dehydrogenase [bacterium]HPN43741.1 phosphoglycerate dehydrogenase [bacterium]